MFMVHFGPMSMSPWPPCPPWSPWSMIWVCGFGSGIGVGAALWVSLSEGGLMRQDAPQPERARFGNHLILSPRVLEAALPP